MGGFVRKVTDAIGLTHHKAEERAARLAEKNSDLSYRLAKEQLDFEKEQYEDWKSIYGSLQENLGNYYNNLNADSLTLKHIEAITREFDIAETQLKQTLAQRGLDDSGMMAAAEVSLASQEALSKANIRANADEIAAQEKMKFLSFGLGQGTQILGQMSNTSMAASQSMSSYASTALSASTNLARINNNAMGGIIGSATGFVLGKFGLK